MEFDLIIPTYKPKDDLIKLLKAIKLQTKQPNQIIVVNTEQKFWRKEAEAVLPIRLIHIKKEEFDHGGTRKMAASLVQSEFFVCMTQDALPKNKILFETLLNNFKKENVAIAYARQETDAKASELERYTREFNYPKERRVKTKEDEASLGIKTWFSSDVCAMYRKSIYDKLGGFVSRTIFNEDMLMAHEAIEAGYQIVYEAKAKVIHYHEYSFCTQFQRNFDLGVSHEEYADVFRKVSSEKEGIKLIKNTARHCLKIGKPHLVFKLVFHSVAKLFGYKLGKNYKKLPRWLLIKLSMNKGYFK